MCWGYYVLRVKDFGGRAGVLESRISILMRSPTTPLYTRPPPPGSPSPWLVRDNYVLGGGVGDSMIFMVWHVELRN